MICYWLVNKPKAETGAKIELQRNEIKQNQMNDMNDKGYWNANVEVTLTTADYNKEMMNDKRQGKYGHYSADYRPLQSSTIRIPSEWTKNILSNEKVIGLDSWRIWKINLLDQTNYKT